MIASYVAEIAEVGDPLSVEQKNGFAIPCHVCGAIRADFTGFCDTHKRRWKKVEADLSTNDHMIGVAKV